jgi:hypothetical protein
VLLLLSVRVLALLFCVSAPVPEMMPEKVWSLAPE